MKTFDIRLWSQNWRPVMNIYGANALFDTGAIIPVISLPKDLLTRRFDAKLIEENVSIGGFGGGKSAGCIYSLANFNISVMHYRILECFVPDKADDDFPIILSAPLLYDAIYTINMKEGKMSVIVADDKLQNNEFKIKELADKICVQVNGILLQG